MFSMELIRHDGVPYHIENSRDLCHERVKYIFVSSFNFTLAHFIFATLK